MIYLDYTAIAADFDRAYVALRQTPWRTNPTDRTNPNSGLIRRCETIWFNREHLETGLIWQQALLGNQTLQYVRHRDFRPLVPEQE